VVAGNTMEGGLGNVAESIMHKMATGCQCQNVAQNDFFILTYLVYPHLYFA